MHKGCDKKMISRGVSFPLKNGGFAERSEEKSGVPAMNVLQYTILEGSVDNPESTMLLVILKAAAKIFVLITSPTGWLHSCCVNNSASV